MVQILRLCQGHRGKRCPAGDVQNDWAVYMSKNAESLLPKNDYFEQESSLFHYIAAKLRVGKHEKSAHQAVDFSNFRG